MTRESVLALLLGVAGLSIVVWIAGEFSSRIRSNQRRAYTFDVMPLWVRSGFAVAPLWAIVFMLFASSILTPHPVGRWIAFVTIAVSLLNVSIAYRRSDLVAPPWLRREIREGSVPLARPDRGDWLLYWIFASVVVVGEVAIIALILWVPSLPS